MAILPAEWSTCWANPTAASTERVPFDETGTCAELSYHQGMKASDPKKPAPPEPEQSEEPEDEVDEAGEESFPASDPPQWTAAVAH